MAVEAQEPLGCLVVDEDGDVEIRDERHRVEDAEDGEVPVADPDLFTGARDPQPVRRPVAQDGRGIAVRCAVQPASAGYVRLQRSQQTGVGGHHRQAVRLGGIHVGVPIGVGVLQDCRAADRVDTVGAGDGVHRGHGQGHFLLGVGVRARCHGQQIGAELVQLGLELGFAGGGDPDDGDHRGDTDGDAGGGQDGTQRSRAQSVRTQSQEIRAPQT